MSVWSIFWSGVHAAFHEPGPLQRRVEAVIYVFIALSVAILVYEVGVAPDDPVARQLTPIDNLMLALFGLELFLRIASYRPAAVEFHDARGLERLKHHITGRLGYMLEPMNLIDLATVLALVPALRGLRALRLLRLLRGAHLFRYSNPFEGLARAFSENRLLFGFGIANVGVATILGGLTLYLVEGNQNPAIDSVGDGLWWGLVTLTTVGFGDIAPVSTLGRIVGGMLMISGMVTLGLFAGIVGHTLPRAVLGVRQEQIRMSGYINHLIVMGYDPGARMFLDALLEERHEGDPLVVLFAPGERPDGVPPEFTWVTGDPTKESELDKVRLAYADKVVIIGNRDQPAQQADAMTILTAFTIRSYLEHHPGVKRARPLYIVAEVLDAENVDHLETAGVDEVVETTKVGYALLAHATEMPGTAALVGELAAVGAHSVYVGQRPSRLSDPMPFGELAAKLKADHGVMLIGVRDKRVGRDTLNPPDTAIIQPDACLIYLSEKACLPPT